MFTARNRQKQNPFAARSRQKQTEAKPKAEPQPAPAKSFDRNSESKEYVQAPDVSTLATDEETEREPSEDEQPLGDLREVAELAEAAREKLAVALDVPVDVITTLEDREKRDEPEHQAKRVAEPAGLTLDDAAEGKTWNSAELGGVTGVEEAPEPKRGRGRPRPQETIDRDNAVHGHLVEAPDGLSKAKLAELVEDKEQQVYSSLRQLSKEGRVETRYVKDVSGYRWFAV